MRLSSIESLKTGEKIATSVYAPNGNKFLSEGVIVNCFIIEKLKEIGIKFIYVYDDRFPDIVRKELISIETVVNLVKTYKSAKEAMLICNSLNEELLDKASKAIVEHIMLAEMPINTIRAFYTIEDPLIGHAIRTAIISVAMGLHLKYNYKQLCELSLAGFMHDFCRNSMSQEEDKEHTENGFEVLKKSMPQHLNSTIAVYQHHENFDGSGFPRGLKGSAISTLSRIISVADHFDTLTSELGMPFDKAYNEILENVDVKFDTMMVNAFSYSMEIYNIGTMVVLNNDIQGIVASQNPGKPLRPNIRLFTDSFSVRWEEINLSQFENRKLNIQSILT